ncbi:MerR family transcriptional regulator [Streptomyces sp. NPDC050636]|uniref:MerR family transcriptional regulator n=1 Tax=Streptomyces sp. NPDC050636 TaxID=3154510 RepID=UPI0034491EB0
MDISFVPPRRVEIGDAAVFAGTTPRAIRHYHDIGLLPEAEQGGDGHSRYGYDDMIRLLWIRKMAEAEMALDDIRDVFHPATGNDSGIEETSSQPEDALAAEEAALHRRRTAVQRMRAEGGRLDLLCETVAERLRNLPQGSLRQADLDALLVSERLFGPLGAALLATRFIALAAHPELRAESDHVDAAEAALDDSVAVDDPRVSEVAALRHAFEQKLLQTIEEDGLDDADEALFDSHEDEETHPAPESSDDAEAKGAEGMSALEAVGKMPYDFSPARVRCMALAQELGQAPAAQD